MRIVFFGSSHGLPEPNRRYSCTMLEIGDRRYLIDVGANALEDLANRGIHPDTVKAIFVTHMHGDHVGALPSFLHLCNWYYTTASPDVCLPCDIDSAKKAIRDWMAVLGQSMRDYAFIRVGDGFEYDDGTLRVRAFRTGHIAESFSFLVEAEGKRVWFSGDLKSPPYEDIPLDVIDDGLDLAVLELAHFKADEKYLPVFRGKTQVKRICINHYSDIRLESYFHLRDALPEIPVSRAYDGLEIVV